MATFDARGSKSAVVVTLSEDDPQVVLVITIASDTEYFSDSRPTFCLCEPQGYGPGDDEEFGYPDALIPETEISPGGGTVTVTFHREAFADRGWPSQWAFAVLHETPDFGIDDPDAEPNLLRLATGWVLVQGIDRALVVESVEFQ